MNPTERCHDCTPINLEQRFNEAATPTTPTPLATTTTEETEEKEVIANPLFEAPVELGECPICYDDLKMVDFTVTKCGHKYHTSCLLKALINNSDCPMCRNELINYEPEEEEDDEDDEADADENADEDADSDDDESSELDDDENKPNISIEQLASKLQNLGYTAVDFLTMYLGGMEMKTSQPERQTDDFLTKLSDTVDNLIDGKITMSHRDTRTYADVLRAANQ